jgi:hypothetical protein
LTTVADEVNRFRVEERFVEPVELPLDRLNAALLFRRPLVRFGTPLLPYVKDAILYQADVAGRRPEYFERGINLRHGYLTEHYVEDEDFVVKVPRGLKEVGVLLEPMTVAQKGITQAYEIQRRMKVGGRARRR